MFKFTKSALAIATFATSLGAMAQATVTPDGKWRSAFGLGASFASGNTRSDSVSLSGDAVKATAQDKLRLYGGALYASTNGNKTADKLNLGGRYDYNLGPVWFGFGGLDFERDTPANLDTRFGLSAGLGYHAIKSATTTWDLFGGLAHTSDKFKSGGNSNYMSLVLGEESAHKLSATTNFTQKLVVLPNLKDNGDYRAAFDAGLAVAMSKGMNLNVGLGWRYNSAPAAGVKKSDTLLTTGVSIKFD